MRVRYSATASADLGDILDYLTERNPRAAVTVGATIETTVARIAAFPESAQAIVERDEVLILRILHGARLRPWEAR